MRLGAVLRSCEMRALVELVKLQQASLEGVILIGIDCPGTYEVSEYYKMQANGEFMLEDHLAAAQNGHEITSEGLSIRNACQICVQQIPTEAAAVRIHIFGADLHTEIPVELDEEFAEKLGVQPQGLAEETGRKNTLEKIVNSHRQVREKELLTIKTRMNSNGGIAGLFETCIRCHNCMTVCPICYCKTCLFRTSSFDHPPEHYLGAARRKGAVRLPGDTLLFHLTRMNHMSASCVSCGMCTSACPSDIQVGVIFSAVGEQVQAVFDYVPGRNLDEPLPLVTFQADEWTQVGEAR